jgi:hypothetical protein
MELPRHRGIPGVVGLIGSHSPLTRAYTQDPYIHIRSKDEFAEVVSYVG